jgi:protein-S-isoprenylcysteine O-methyltransferase Ste14
MVDTERTDRVPTRIMVGRVLSAGFAIGCYVGFVAVFLYAIAFLGDFGVPRTVDGGPDAGTAAAAMIDTLLLTVFAAQHSVMARPAFKQRWTTLVPRHVERSIYVLASSAAMALAFWLWRPIPTVVWEVAAPPARVLLWTLFAAGWAWVLAMSFAISHFDMFGLRQVALHLRGLGEGAPGFAQPLPYRLMRHPMMLGFFVAFLATPTMTVGHLLFAVLGCAYILVGVRLEERDLATALPPYAAYAAVTPRFFPRVARRSARLRGTRRQPC